MNSPWLKFYPSDWRADPALRVCSLAARGLWMEMLCVMHEAVPRGSLRVNGRPLNNKQLAALVGAPLRDVEQSLIELEVAGVYSRDAGNTIMSRRMVRDTEKSERDKQNGKGGGNPILKPPVGEGVNPPVIPTDNGEDKAQRLEARLPEEVNIRPKPARRRISYTPGFQAFWKAYPTDELMSKSKAFEAWQRLEPEQQSMATGAISAFRGYCSSHPDYRAVHAVRFLSENRFEGFAQVAERAATEVFVKRGTPAWQAWEQSYLAKTGKTPPVDRDGGWRFPSEFPPQNLNAA